MADIVRAQRNESLSAARRRDKLNLKVVGVVNLDDCAEVA